jgi:hypothetical protein
MNSKLIFAPLFIESIENSTYPEVSIEFGIESF